MKSGASENDIFGDEADETDEQDTDETSRPDAQPTDRSRENSPSMSDSEPSTQPRVEQIPYKFRRSTVKEGRQHVPLYLREHVLREEGAFRTAVEEQLNEDVPKADLREAAYIVAQRHPDLVADELREWGYDME